MNTNKFKRGNKPKYHMSYMIWHMTVQVAGGGHHYHAKRQFGMALKNINAGQGLIRTLEYLTIFHNQIYLPRSCVKIFKQVNQWGGSAVATTVAKYHDAKTIEVKALSTAFRGCLGTLLHGESQSTGQLKWVEVAVLRKEDSHSHAVGANPQFLQIYLLNYIKQIIN